MRRHPLTLLGSVVASLAIGWILCSSVVSGQVSIRPIVKQPSPQAILGVEVVPSAMVSDVAAVTLDRVADSVPMIDLPGFMAVAIDSILAVSSNPTKLPGEPEAVTQVMKILPTTDAPSQRFLVLEYDSKPITCDIRGTKYALSRIAVIGNVVDASPQLYFKAQDGWYKADTFASMDRLVKWGDAVRSYDTGD